MHVDHRIEITIPDEDRDAETSDRLLAALFDLLPHADSVIDQNLESCELTAMFAVDGATASDAAMKGIEVFEIAVDRAGVGRPEAIRVLACSSRP